MTDDKIKRAIQQYHDLRNPLAAGLFRDKPEITIKEPEEKPSVLPERENAFETNPFMQGFREKTPLSQYFEEPVEEEKDKKAPPWLKKKDGDDDNDDSDSDSKDKDDDGDSGDSDDTKDDSKEKGKKDKKGDKGKGDKKVVINIKEGSQEHQQQLLDEGRLKDAAGDIWEHVKDVVRGKTHPHYVDHKSTALPTTNMHVWHNKRTGEVHEGQMHVHADGTCSTCHHSEGQPKLFHISHYIKSIKKAFQHPGVV